MAINNVTSIQAPDQVDAVSPQIAAMRPQWQMVEALLGGTEAMRRMGAVYLPGLPMEDAADYDIRLSKATLFQAFERTLGVMVGKPFSRPLELQKNVPAAIQTDMVDADLEGRNLHNFMVDVMWETLAYGLNGVMTDYSTVPEVAAGGRLSIAQENALGVRPYLVHIRHDQILGWRSTRIGGRQVLTQLRVNEFVEEDVGRFGSQLVQRVKVWEPTQCTTFRKIVSPTGIGVVGWEEEEPVANTLGFIPFTPFYGRRLGFMDGVSPLLNLAFKNVEYWQESSDQKEAIRAARRRLLVIVGLEPAPRSQDAPPPPPIVASSNYALRLPAGCSAEVVQGSAESVVQGRAELQALRDEMVQMGAELLIPKPGERSATEANNDAEANKSDLQRIVEVFGDSVDQVLQCCAAWRRLPDGGNCSIFKDFGAVNLNAASAELVLKMQGQSLLSKKTTITEMQNRGVISDEVDPDMELEAIEEQGPDLGALGAAMPPGASRPPASPAAPAAPQPAPPAAP